MCTTNAPASVRSLLTALLAASPRVSSAALAAEVGDSDGDHGTELTSAAVVTVTFDNGCVWRYGCGVARYGEGFGVSDDDLADEVGDDGAKVWGVLGAVADGAPAALRGVDGAGPWTLTRAELGAPQVAATID